MEELRGKGRGNRRCAHLTPFPPPGPTQGCCPARLCQGLPRPQCSQQSSWCLTAGTGWFCGPGIVKCVRPCDAIHGVQDFLVKAGRAAGASLVLISPLFTFFLVEKGRLRLVELPAHLQLRQQRCQPRRRRCIPSTARAALPLALPAGGSAGPAWPGHPAELQLPLPQAPKGDRKALIQKQ